MGSGILQPTHLIFLLLLALLLFGAKRLPEIGRSLGVGMREFKDSVSGMTDSKPEETRSELPPPTAAPAAPPVQEASVVAAAPAEPAPAAAAAEPKPEHETEPVS
jgi:sec-independent protein translocase protein TatA